jgi:hypothetical protein
MTAAEAGAPKGAAAEATAAAPAAPQHVGGISLGLAALWAAVKNFFRRVFGRKDAET